MQKMGTGVFMPRSSVRQVAATTRPSQVPQGHAAQQLADAGVSDTETFGPSYSQSSHPYSSGLPAVPASHTSGLASLAGAGAHRQNSGRSPTGPIGSPLSSLANARPLGHHLTSPGQAERRSFEGMLPRSLNTAVPAAAHLHCTSHSRPPLSGCSRRSSSGHSASPTLLFAAPGSDQPEDHAADMMLFAAATSSSLQAPPASACSPFAMHPGQQQQHHHLHHLHLHHLQHLQARPSFEATSSTSLDALLQLQAPLAATSVDSALGPVSFTPGINEHWQTSTAAAAAAAAADQQNNSNSMSLAAASSLMLPGQARSSASTPAALSGALGGLQLEGHSPLVSSTALTGPAHTSLGPQSSGLLLLQNTLPLADMDLQQMSADDLAVLAAEVAQGKLAQIEQLKAMQQLLRQELISLLPLI